MSPADTERAPPLTLNPELVAEASSYTHNLGATLDRLLGDYVARERHRRHNATAALGQLIAALEATHDTTGLLSDEFSAL